MKTYVGTPYSPVRGEKTYLDGSKSEGVFFGASSFGNQIFHPIEKIGRILCIPDRVQPGDGKLIGWEFCLEDGQDLPEWPGSFPRVDHGRVVSTLRRNDWKESWIQTWVLNPETLVWEGGGKVY